MGLSEGIWKVLRAGLPLLTWVPCMTAAGCRAYLLHSSAYWSISGTLAFLYIVIGRDLSVISHRGHSQLYSSHGAGGYAGEGYRREGSSTVGLSCARDFPE